MKEIKVLEGKVVAPEGMKVGIVASRFNEIIVNKLLGGAVDGLVRHGVEEENITAAWVPGAFEIPVVYMVVFGNIAKLGTDGIPQLLFYLSGNALWSYFASCLNGNAATFTSNARLFGKVYFPRLTVPISNVLCSVIRFGIQMLLVVILLGYYIWKGAVSPHWEALLLIFLLLLWLGCMGMGVGILISSVTTKYRDLSVLVGFGMSLWMYGTPVVYPMSILPEGILKKIILLNPVTAPMEMFRYILLGEGSILPVSIGVSLLFTILVMLGGIVVFNKVERTFMDTV